MRPITLALALLVLTAACENSNDPLLIGIGGSGGSPVTPVQVTGDWTFTVTKTATLACTGGSIADGSRLTAHLDILSAGTAGSASSWQSPSSASALPVSGAVSLSDGRGDFILGSGVGTTAGMELKVTITPGGTFSGLLTDPAAGLSPMFSAGGCEYSTNGTKA